MTLPCDECRRFRSDGYRSAAGSLNPVPPGDEQESSVSAPRITPRANSGRLGQLIGRARSHSSLTRPACRQPVSVTLLLNN